MKAQHLCLQFAFHNIWAQDALHQKFKTLFDYASNRSLVPPLNLITKNKDASQ